MIYHFVINGYAEGCLTQVKEQIGFAGKYLADGEQGETIILCRERDQIGHIREVLHGEAIAVYSETYSPEGILKVFETIIETEDIYIFGSDYSGQELCVRAAARKKGSSVVNVHAMETGSCVNVRKMVYSNHMEGIFSMNRAPYCVSVARGSEQAEQKEGEFWIIDEISCTNSPAFILSSEVLPDEEIYGIEGAKVVIAAGRGTRSKENIEKLGEVARALGGEVGVSRPAAMNAWAPMSRLIGVSGAMISPQICITAGVSGAAAFYAGIEKSKFIAAINIDGKASIMRQADVVIEDDFMDVLEALKEIVE